MDAFLSHSHADARTVEYLANRLVDEAKLRVWLDKWQLVPGEGWQRGLSKGIAQSKSCVVFVGKDVPQGWFYQEIQRALNRQARDEFFRVIPVLLPGSDPAYVDDFLELRTWVDFRHGLDDENAFHNLVAGIKGLSPGRFGPAEKPSLRNPYFLNPLSPFYIKREDAHTQLVSMLVHDEDSGYSQPIVINGMGGIGKSMLSLGVCHEPVVQERFHDGIIYLTIGRDPGNLLAQMRNIGDGLGDHLSYYSTPEDSESRLKKLFYDKSVLVVLDDVWEVEHARKLHFSSARSRYIITTRSGNIASVLDGMKFNLDTWEPRYSAALLEAVSRKSSPDYLKIADVLDHHPLALTLAGKLLAEGMDTQTWLDKYRGNASALNLDPHSKDKEQNLAACFDLSMEQLPPDNRTLFYSLGVFPEGVSIPKQLILKYWMSIHPNMSETHLDDLVYLMRRYALFTIDSDREIRLHDLLHDYAKHQIIGEYASYQSRLLAVYNSGGKTAWHELELNDYMRRHLAYHLIHAGREGEINEILSAATRWMDQYLKQPERQIETLVVNLWNAWQRLDQSNAEAFLVQQWLSRRMQKSAGRGYTSKLVAVRCAYEVSSEYALSAALIHADSRVRLSALQYAYFFGSGGRNDFDRLVRILEMVRGKVTRFGLVPNPAALQSIFLLCLLIMIDQYQLGRINAKVLSRVMAVLLNSINDVQSSFIMRLLSGSFRSFVVKFVANLLIGLLTEANQTTVNNLSSIGKYFRQSMSLREFIRASLKFINREEGELKTLSDVLLTLYRAEDRFSVLLAEYIIIGHGIHDPDGAAAVLFELGKLPDPGCEYLFSASHIWYTIMDRQTSDTIKEKGLRVMRSLVVRWLDEGRHGYGVVLYDNRTYQVYPLAYYAALWTKVHPGIQVDLFLEYADKAERENDLALKRHIIGSFGDFRTRLYDYPTALKILTPYIKRDAVDDGKEDERELLQKSLREHLGILRGLNPSHVDAYLDHIEAPTDIVDGICIQSYEKTFIDLSMRTYQLTSDIIGYAPSYVISRIVTILEKALNEKSLGGMLSVLTNDLIEFAQSSRQQLLFEDA